MRRLAALVHEAGDGSVGIGSPGSNSRMTGLWRNANILFCNGKPFQRDLEAAIGRPVKMENDANCFALSEAIDGAGQGYAVVAFFTVGTALGGGLVMNGKLVVGANGEAGEFGHTALPWPNDSEWPLLACYCGKKGCAEQYVSGTGLQRDHSQRHGRRHLKQGDRGAGAPRRCESAGLLAALAGPLRQDCAHNIVSWSIPICL